jgi:hypothetical protein
LYNNPIVFDPEIHDYMLAIISFSLSLISIGALVLFPFTAGLWLGTAKRSKIEKKIRQLETEMLNSHAEILRLSKEIADKETEQSKTLVVPLHEMSSKKSREQRPLS